MIITARDLSTLAPTIDLIRKISPKTEVLALELDITDEEAVIRAFAAAAEKFGHIDILINNAGQMIGDGQTLKSATIDKWWADIDTNVKGTMLVTREFLKQLPSIPRSMRPADIVFLPSSYSLKTFPGASAYPWAKILAAKFAQQLAAEHSPEELGVVAINPGVVMTDLVPPWLEFAAKDTPELTGGFANWCCSSPEGRRAVRGKMVGTNWEVEEMMRVLNDGDRGSCQWDFDARFLDPSEVVVKE